MYFFQKMEKFLKEIAEITRKTVKKGSFKAGYERTFKIINRT